MEAADALDRAARDVGNRTRRLIGPGVKANGRRVTGGRLAAFRGSALLLRARRLPWQRPRPCPRLPWWRRQPCPRLPWWRRQPCPQLPWWRRRRPQRRPWPHRPRCRRLPWSLRRRPWSRPWRRRRSPSRLPSSLPRPWRLRPSPCRRTVARTGRKRPASGRRQGRTAEQWCAWVSFSGGARGWSKGRGWCAATSKTPRVYNNIATLRQHIRQSDARRVARPQHGGHEPRLRHKLAAGRTAGCRRAGSSRPRSACRSGTAPAPSVSNRPCA